MDIPIAVNIFLSLTISFVNVYFTIPFIIKAAQVKNLFAVPNQRTAAKTVIPTLGGIAILAGFMISLIIASGSYSIDELKYLLAAVIIMFIIGLNDDILGSTARRKLLLELPMAIYLVVVGNYRLTDFHGIIGIHQIGYLPGIILSVVAIIGIINAFNLIDGIDGLAAGTGILISMVYGVWFLDNSDTIYALTCFSLAGSLSAFFLYNVFGVTNKIFLGDTGTLIIGIIVAVLTIHFNEFFPVSNFPVHGLPALSLAIMILPVVETIKVSVIRIGLRKSPFSPDMNHIHHQVLRLTNNHFKASLIIISANGLFIFLAYHLIDLLGNGILFIVLLTLGFIFASIPSFILRISEKNVLSTGHSRL